MPKPLVRDDKMAPSAANTGWIEALAEISRELAAGADLQRVLDSLVAGLARLVDAEDSQIHLHDEAGDSHRLSASDVEAKSGWPRPLSAQRRAGKSLIRVPIQAGGRPVGLVELTCRQAEGGVDGIDFRLLAILGDAAGLAIENLRLKESLAEQEGVRRELQLAAQIQRSLLPKRDAENFPIFGINRPIRQVSGDFYDFFAVPCGDIPFAVGDVSGKGIEAALLMSKTASLFRYLGKTHHDPAKILSIINREICETVSRGRFVTMVAGVYEPSSGHLRFANAGHEPPLLRHPDRHYQTFPATAPPLGILPDLDIELYDVALGGGEFYVFTDGLTEYHYGSDEELGVEGVIQLVESLSGESLEDRMHALLNELDQGGWQVRDDLTLLAINDAHGWTPGEGARAPKAKDDPGAMECILEARLAARADRLVLVRANVVAAARACGFDEDVCQDIALAVSEACQNVIVHGYRGRSDGEIRLALFRHEQGLLVRISDDCPTLDPATVRPRDLADVRPGGLGTHFMTEIMDELAFRPGPGGSGNILEMIKKRDQ